MSPDDFIYYDKHDLIKRVSSSNISLNEEIMDFPSSLSIPKSANQSLMERFVQSNILFYVCYDYRIEVIRKPKGELSFLPETLALTTLNYNLKSFKTIMSLFYCVLNAHVDFFRDADFKVKPKYEDVNYYKSNLFEIGFSSNGFLVNGIRLELTPEVQISLNSNFLGRSYKSEATQRIMSNFLMSLLESTALKIKAMESLLESPAYAERLQRGNGVKNIEIFLTSKNEVRTTASLFERFSELHLLLLDLEMLEKNEPLKKQTSFDLIRSSKMDENEKSFLNISLELSVNLLSNLLMLRLDLFKTSPRNIITREDSSASARFIRYLNANCFTFRYVENNGSLVLENGQKIPLKDDLQDLIYRVINNNDDRVCYIVTNLINNLLYSFLECIFVDILESDSLLVAEIISDEEE